MEIKGKLGYLTEEERDATGLLSPIPLSRIDPMDLISSLYERGQGIEAMRAADDDELTHAERASIVPLFEKLQIDYKIIENLASQLTAHEAEVFLQGN